MGPVTVTAEQDPPGAEGGGGGGRGAVSLVEILWRVETMSRK